MGGGQRATLQDGDHTGDAEDDDQHIAQILRERLNGAVRRLQPLIAGDFSSVS